MCLYRYYLQNTDRGIPTVVVAMVVLGLAPADPDADISKGPGGPDANISKGPARMYLESTSLLPTLDVAVEEMLRACAEGGERNKDPINFLAAFLMRNNPRHNAQFAAKLEQIRKDAATQAAAKAAARAARARKARKISTPAEMPAISDTAPPAPAATQTTLGGSTSQMGAESDKALGDVECPRVVMFQKHAEVLELSDGTRVLRPRGLYSKARLVMTHKDSDVVELTDGTRVLYRQGSFARAASRGPTA